MPAQVMSPAGVLEPLNKSRQQRVYWRPVKHEDGTVEWIKTLPLPSDMQGRELYLGKGFRLTPPPDASTSIAEAPESKAIDMEKEALFAEIAQLRTQLEEAKRAKHPGGRRKVIKETLE